MDKMNNDNINIDKFLNIPPSETNPSGGMLLIASPMSADSIFARSVILLLERGSDDTHLGLILNLELELPVKNVIEGWPEDSDMNLCSGGPVEMTQMFLLHRLEGIRDSVEICPGLYCGGDMQQLLDYVESGKPTEGVMRIYVGYAGWGTDQLTKEILENSWAVNSSPKADLLLTGTGQEFWRRAVGDLGENYRSWLSMPIHPSCN
ncbi:MAG: YqgE/AlgH family protein [Muribaculaceae bacterium]|nr:YqgE/AlgH family protein [Muribaculaceae bacterium]